ncbi:hypothetical protein QF038_001912 [Pseudarthrobacter sp. W1I19]|nr:hypothetical protein [Pseudarthrobacter sp. W1I19]
MIAKSSSGQTPQHIPGVIFYDPLCDRIDDIGDEGFEPKLDYVPQPKGYEKSDRRQLQRRKALEAVSRDLAILASREGVRLR